MPNEYFAYGSNLDRRRFAARCPGSRPVAAAELRGYRLAFRGNGHADIVRQKGGVVKGALYNVTSRDAKTLDFYEGVPVYYHRIVVFVRDEGGRVHRALAYKMRSDVTDAAPSLSYALTIFRGCRDWNIEPDDEVKAAVATAQFAPGGEE
jgi:gamma-glutamylcyclotransferase (GGCT)/AIG2-like uncharacterized protein YtfP